MDNLLLFVLCLCEIPILWYYQQCLLLPNSIKMWIRLCEKKWSDLINKGVLLLQDNARFHTAHVNICILQTRLWDIVTSPLHFESPSEWISPFWTLKRIFGRSAFQQWRWSEAGCSIMVQEFWHIFLCDIQTSKTLGKMHKCNKRLYQERNSQEVVFPSNKCILLFRTIKSSGLSWTCILFLYSFPSFVLLDTLDVTNKNNYVGKKLFKKQYEKLNSESSFIINYVVCFPQPKIS